MYRMFRSVHTTAENNQAVTMLMELEWNSIRHHSIVMEEYYNCMLLSSHASRKMIVMMGWRDSRELSRKQTQRQLLKCVNSNDCSVNECE